MSLDQSNPDFDLTQSTLRCGCGNDVLMHQRLGGFCDVCNKTIPADARTFDSSATVSLKEFIADPNTSETTVADDSFEVVGVDPLIGQYFGHFKIINRIGRGGMGHVYRAVDISLRRFVAVKVLKSGSDWSNQSSADHEVELLLQEAVAQARVNHPNVVTIFYVGKQENEPFLAMELVRGQPLSERIKSEDAIPFPKIVRYGLQIANALKFAQKLDIIHGDIKPSNLLVQDDDTVKLSDFGMARRESKVADSIHGGTPNYLAPELIHGGETSIQTDIYALGVTLYEMTFGVLPIKLTGRKPKDWTEDHFKNEVAYPIPWPEHLPENWKSMLKQMLHKDPTQRYQSYNELIADFKSVEALSTIQAKRVPRLLAGLFDCLSVLLVAAAIQYLLFSVLRLRDYTENLAIVFFVSLVNLLPILLYSATVFFFRQSVGRNLLYLRVVNRYGMRPPGRRMLTRSFVRMGVVWLLIASMVFDAQGIGWAENMRTFFASAAILFLILQVTILMFNRDHRTIQDMVYKTDVVLDT